MWLLKLLDRITDLINIIDLINDIRRKDWHTLLWTLLVTACIAVACWLLHINPVLGAISFAGLIVVGFVLLIRRALLDEKKAHKKREEAVQKTETEEACE